MNKTATVIIVVVVLVLIVGAGGAYVMRRQALNNSVPVSPTAGQTVTTATTMEVDLTDTGFSPSTVTIKQGDTVHFVNKSSGQMHVASNPHPTHTDYPGFDELQAGDTYDFTFTKIGSWGYHNHLNPSTKGTVVVTQ